MDAHRFEDLLKLLVLSHTDDSINMLEIDHATKQVFSSTIVSNSENAELQMIPTHVIEQSIAHWMGNPSMIDRKSVV